MEDYTKENVIKALSAISFSSRKRCLVDQRSYLIGILVYKFMMPPREIAKETGADYETTKLHIKKKSGLLASLLSNTANLVFSSTSSGKLFNENVWLSNVNICMSPYFCQSVFVIVKGYLASL